MARIANHMAKIDGYSEKAPHEAILDLPQERITGDILRGRGPRRGNLERLIRYWRPIMRKPGGFRRCLVILADHPELYPLERICAWLHHETTGLWPNEGNHHAGGKLGPIVKRTVKKRGRRKRRGKSDVITPGVDFPLDRLERRLERKSGSILYAPLDGSIGQLEYKSGRVKRIERAITSVLLPGERGALKPRHLLRTGLTPGGSGAPGPRLQISPGAGALRRGGATRGFRCPPGFERGGHFTDSRFSTCGHQLFGVPGSGRTALRTVSAAAAQRPTDEQRAAARARQKVGDRTLLRVKADGPTPGVGGGMPKLPAAVGSPNEAKQREMVSKVLKSMSGVTEKTEAPIRRLVREDGSILQPLAPLNIIGKQKNNPDLRNAALLTRINEPGKFGLDELMLMQTGLRSIEFSLPGGGSVSLKRNGGPMPPGKARAFGKAIAQAKRMPLTDMDYAGILRETAAKTNAVTFSATVPGGGDANRIVRVTGPDGAKRVPYWVYKAFLSSSHKMAGEEAEAPAEAGEKSLSDWPNENWGPLQYTAALIPDYDAIDHTGGVAYKAAALSGYRKDITERFVEVKRIGSVWDRGINRFRCPPGMSNAGQITNRVGLGCGVPSLPDGGRGRGIEGLLRDIDGIDTNPGNRFIKLQGRVEAAVGGGAGPEFGPMRARIGRVLSAEREEGVGVRQKRRVARLKDRIANILDVPGDDIESRKLSMIQRGEERRRAAMKDRIANVLDVPGDTAESLALRQARDGDRRERVGLAERFERRRERVKRRIARVLDPVHVREEREDQNWLPGERAQTAPEFAKHNRAAIADRLVFMRGNWNEQLGKRRYADIDRDEPREWLVARAADLPDEEFRKLEDDVLDFEILLDALDGPDDRLASAIDRVSPERHGYINADAYGRRTREVADEKAELDKEAKRIQRMRSDLSIRDDMGIDNELVGQLDNYAAVQVIDKVEENKKKIQALQARIRAGREDKDGVDKLLADVVRERDRHRSALEMLRAGNGTPEEMIRETILADMYDQALPEIVGEALRFERLDQLKRNQARSGLGAYIFNNPDELNNVPEDRMPKSAYDKLEQLVIDIGNADTPEELNQLADDLQRTIDEAASDVSHYDALLKDPNLDEAGIQRIAKNRGEAAWAGEVSERAGKALRRRKSEVGVSEFINPAPKRLNGNLGEFDVNGMPQVKRVEVGHLGINTQAGANKHLHDGGDMKDVPDDFLAEAIRANPSRFSANIVNNDQVNDVVEYRDRKTGRQFFIKTTDGGPHEPVMEMVANQMLAKMGMPVGNIRFGSPTETVMQQDRVYPNDPSYGPANQISIVFEHGNELFDGALDRPGVNDRYAGKKITDVKSFVRGWLIDYFSANEDRHPKNWFYQNLPDGKVGMVPIDHGLGWGRFGAMDPPWPLDAMSERDYDIAPDVWRPEGGRVQWVQYLGEKLRLGQFSYDEVADEVQGALADLDEQSLGEIIAEIKRALPPGYQDDMRGIKWDDVVPGIAVPRINRLRNMSRSELMEFLHSL